MTREDADYASLNLRVDADAPPCPHCGAHTTHWTEYHGSYDCHCECCGRAFKCIHSKVCRGCGHETPHRVEEKDHGGREYECSDCSHRVMHG